MRDDTLQGSGFGGNGLVAYAKYLLVVQCLSKQSSSVVLIYYSWIVCNMENKNIQAKASHWIKLHSDIGIFRDHNLTENSWIVQTGSLNNQLSVN